MDVEGEKRVAIVQSCYIPWKGYFDLIAQVDEFILLDDAQFTRRDWRNRNQIKTPQGPRWLTIPVESKGKFHARVEEVQTQGLEWARKHWETLQHNYAKAPHFRQQGDWVKELYSGLKTTRLSEINRRFIEGVCAFLKLDTALTWSTDYGRSDLGKTDRLLELCQASGAAHYLSGPSAKSYLEHDKFEQVGVSVSYADYGGYPEYPGQPHPPFSHHVTILDLIFSVGENARDYMRHAA